MESDVDGGGFQITLGSQIYENIDAALHSTLADGTARVMAGVAMLYGTLWTLQFTTKTLVWYWQGLNVAIQEIVFSTLRMAAIAAFAFNVGWYISFVVPIVTELPIWIGNQLISDKATQMNAIDAILSGFLNVIVKIWSKLSIFDLSSSTLEGVMVIILMLIGGIPFLTVAIGTLVVLKLSTLLLLVVGPIFIAFLLFDSTRQWFWSWVSTVSGFMLTHVLFSIAISFQLNFINTNIMPGGEIKGNWVGAFSVLVVFNAFTVIATALPNIAASVMGGGGAPTASAGGLMGRTLGAATGMGMAKKMAAYFAASRLLRNRIS